MNTKYYLTTAMQALIAATLILALLVTGYFFAEPRVGIAQATSTFTINQVITGEISFLVNAASTTLVGSLNGITGGTATSSTYAVVQTNSNTGYNMTIGFFNNGSAQTMQGRVSGSDSLRDLPATSSQPNFLFSTASTSAVFGYTVAADTPSDLDQSFLNNSTVCNAGSTYTSNRCWMEPTVSAFQIINRTTSAVSGATTTIHFQVYVPNNPTPGLVADTYTATATLTATNQ